MCLWEYIFPEALVNCSAYAIELCTLTSGADSSTIAGMMVHLAKQRAMGGQIPSSIDNGITAFTIEFEGREWNESR